MDKKLDDVIRADFKLINGDLSGACILAALIPFVLITLYMAVLVIPIGIGVFYCLAKAYTKLFYDSVFGKSAGLYQALPVSHGDRITSKIYTAAVCQLIPLAVCVASFCFANIIMGNNPFDGSNLFTDIVRRLIEEGMTGLEVGLNLSALLLTVLANLLAYASLIFCAVTFYQTQPAERHNGTWRLGVGIIAWLLLRISLSGTSWLFEKLQLDMMLLELGLDFLLQIAILVVTFKVSVQLLEKHYKPE